MSKRNPRACMPGRFQFNITMKQGTVQGINHRSCTHLHRCDGYSYQKGEAAFSPHPDHGIGLHAALE